MTNEALTEYIVAQYAEAVAEQGTQFLHVNALAEDWASMSSWLKHDESLKFDFLFCLTCVDWNTHLGMVYHLRSYFHQHEIVVKIKLDRGAPAVASCANVWRTAEFHEREVFELFGVHFINHPDLRKLILPDDWEGYPMRKDYDDPVNMIKL